MNNVICIVLLADFDVYYFIVYGIYLSRLAKLFNSKIKALASLERVRQKKLKKSPPKLSKKRFTEVGVMVVLKLLAINKLDH